RSTDHGTALGSGLSRARVASPASSPGTPGCALPVAPRAPRTRPSGAAGTCPAAQSDRDDHGRSDRAVGVGPSSGQDFLAPADPHRRHHLSPHPWPAHLGLTCNSHHAPKGQPGVVSTRRTIVQASPNAPSGPKSVTSALASV